MNIKLLKEKRMLVAILLLSFVLKLVYIFYCTHYQNYLFSDMRIYWDRALDRYNGELFSISQWGAWTPFYSYYLVFIFKVLKFIGLFNYKLEVVLVLNVVYSTISALFVYLIARQLSLNEKYCFLATALYAFSYHVAYLNVLNLSENLAMPLLIAATYFVIAYYEDKKYMLLAGIVFALAVVTRPSFSVFFLLLLSYVVFVRGVNLRTVVRGLMFTAGFSLIILSVVIEYNHVSGGKLRTLAGHSGINFYMSLCKKGVIAPHYSFSSPMFSTIKSKPTQFSKFEVPAYEQGFYYKEGWKCVKNNPKFIQEHIPYFKDLIFGFFFVKFADVKWFNSLIDISDWILFGMVLSLGLFFFLIKNKKPFAPDLRPIYLLLGFPLLVVLASWFFCIEQRFLVPVFFAIHLLFCYLYQNFGQVKAYLKQYAMFLFVLSLVVAMLIDQNVLILPG